MITRESGDDADDDDEDEDTFHSKSFPSRILNEYSQLFFFVAAIPFHVKCGTHARHITHSELLGVLHSPLLRSLCSKSGRAFQANDLDRRAAATENSRRKKGHTVQRRESMHGESQAPAHGAADPLKVWELLQDFPLLLGLCL